MYLIQMDLRYSNIRDPDFAINVAVIEYVIADVSF